jgi:hypothetical protein
MKIVSKSAKDLIQKILLQEKERIAIADIFNIDWVKK